MDPQLSNNLIPPDESDKMNKNKHLLIGAFFILIAFILLIAIFLFYKNSMDSASGPLTRGEGQQADSIYINYNDDFALAVEEYLIVQEKINEVIKKEMAYSDENDKSGEELAMDKPAVLGMDNSGQEEADLSRGERIARGVAAFWEIGRNKHIGEALSVNEEDLRFISQARQGVNFALADLEKLEDKIPNNHADEIRFLSKAGKYYRGLEKFLYQLKLYKDFNGEQIKAVTSGRLLNFSDDIMNYYQQSFDLSEEAKFQYLSSTKDQAGNLYQDGVTAISESVSGLEGSVIPPDFIDPDILAELVRLRLEMFGKAIAGFEQVLSGMEEQMKDGAVQKSEQTDLLAVKNKIDEVLLRLKVSSNISNLFNEIAKIDKELKDELPNLKPKYNFALEKNQPYLIDLISQYKRGKSEKYAELEAYAKKAGEELESFKTGSSYFDLKKPVAKIKVSLIFPPECNQGVIFYLKSPGGSIIGTDSLLLHDNVSYGTTFNTRFFIISNPEIGRWEENAKLPIDCRDSRFEVGVIEESRNNSSENNQQEISVNQEKPENTESFKSEDENKVSDKNIKNTINDWVVYQNDEYEFIFKHPSFCEIKLKDSQSNTFSIDCPTQENDIHNFMLFTPHNNNLTFDQYLSKERNNCLQWHNEFNDNAKDANDDIVVKDINNIKTISNITGCGHNVGTPNELWLFNKDESLVVNFLGNIFTNEKDITEEIIDSFRFIEKVDANEDIDTKTNNSFKLFNIEIGSKVAAMNVLSMAPFNQVHNMGVPAWEISDSNAIVEFGGNVTISGNYYFTSEGPHYNDYCFTNLDSISASKLPKIENDNRATWFCFSNKIQAQKLFENEKGKSTIEIDKYVINSYPSQVFNTANIKKVIEKK